MKSNLIFFLLIFSTSVGFGQVSPEDIIIVYDSLNPNGKVILKDELSSNLDSLDGYLVNDKKIELMTKLDTITIKNLLIGTWIKESVKRINGENFNLVSAEQYIFNENLTYVEIHEDHSMEGKWSLGEILPSGSLKLTYDEPLKRELHMDMETMKKIYSDKMIEDLLFIRGNTLSIKSINEQMLVFMTFIPKHPEDFDDSSQMLILTTYKRTE